jgi:hypothetical protein
VLGAVLLVAALCSWFVRCRPHACDVLAAAILGLAIGGAGLGVVLLIVVPQDQRATGVLAMVAIVLALLAIVWWLVRCSCETCRSHAEAGGQTYPRVGEPRPAPAETRPEPPILIQRGVDLGDGPPADQAHAGHDHDGQDHDGHDHEALG